MIAQGWCGAIAAALLLDLPITCIYLEPSMIPFYGPLLSSRSVTVRDLSTVDSVVFPSSTVLVVHGSTEFYSRLDKSYCFQNVQRVMWIVNKPQDRTSSKSAQRMLVAAAKDCQRHNLLPLTFKHRDYGGATTAQHIIGFSSGFGLSAATFSHPPNVDRTLRHFWKPAEKLMQPVHLWLEITNGLLSLRNH